MYLTRSKNGDRLHVTPQRERQLRKVLRQTRSRDSVTGIIAKARRIDSPLHSRVRFSSRTDKGIYTILTAPLKSNGNKIYTVLRVLRRHGASSELEVKDEVQALITWDSTKYRIRTRNGDRPITSVKRHGIYVIERNKKPLYVGISWTGTIGSRFRCRLATFAQLAMPAEIERMYTIRVGDVQALGVWKGRSKKDLFESIERVLIRYLIKVRRYGLTNRKSRLPFTVAKAGISIENMGPKPDYLPATIKRKADDRLEIGIPPLFRRHPSGSLVTR